MSTTKKVLIALVSMVMIILISYSSYWGMQYNKAIRLIEEKSYAEAEDILFNSHVSNLYDKNGFVSCYARMCQYDSVEDASIINSYLSQILKNYNGIFGKEISKMREENNTNYEIYLKEEEKRREEREKKLQEEYGSKVPYEGMSEEYINYTMVGRYNEREEESFSHGEYHITTYIWYAKWYDPNSKSIGLKVKCQDGKVTDVIKMNYYWTEDGMPNTRGVPIDQFAKYKRKYSSKSTEKKKKSDPYDVYEYDDPEDFYYDNYDDFECYEDAEDYFDDHNY